MNKVITISREFGSGGREFGRRLAEELGFDYYDKEIISEIAKKTSMSEEFIKEVTDKKPHNLFPITFGHTFIYIDNYYPLHQANDIYIEQNNIIKEMAQRSNCIIIGRCADYILEDKDPFRIFVYADMESKVKRCKERAPEGENLNDKELRKKINSVNKGRAQYYEYYTGRNWGDKLNYDLCINTTNANIKELVEVVAKLFK